jgi:hypothetical protein
MVELSQLPDEWHRAPRRWGHRLHGICSYMAMFPPTIPHVFTTWLTEPGDVVYDPFCGRGTTPLEACLRGRIGLGSDANPLAVLLTQAKLDPPPRRKLDARIAELRCTLYPMDSRAEPPHVRMLFSEITLGQLIFLRQALDLSSRVDRFLMAALLGILHANANRDGRPRGLTVAMPNTFSMSPGYVSKYIQAHNLQPPQTDVLDALERRLASFSYPGPTFRKGRGWLHDATQEVHHRLLIRPARLIFTSPPYLEVIKYGKYNWLRLWLIGDEPKRVDSNLFASGSLPRYLEFVRRALMQLRPALRDDGFACFAIGDVRRGDNYINLAEAVAEECIPLTDLRTHTIIKDAIPVGHKVSRIWGPARGRATKTDRILIVRGPGAPKLPPIPTLDWNSSLT